MFTKSTSTNVEEKIMINVDVEGKTKQLRIGDISKSMDQQEKEQKSIKENLFFANDKVCITNNDTYKEKTQMSNLYKDLDNDMNFQKNLKAQFINFMDADKVKNDIELDLRVPTVIKDKIGMSVSRGMESFLIKSPDFFKKVNKQDDDIPKRVHYEYVPKSRYDYDQNSPSSMCTRNLDKNLYNENDLNDLTRFHRNVSNPANSDSQGSPSGFSYQSDVFHQFPADSDSYYMSQIHNNYLLQSDLNSQSNNLFGQPFVNFNKKRSYSEADLNKPSRTPFSNFRRSSQFGEDYHKKSGRSVSDTCIDPRMFYKNICGNQITNKENYTKPAFSYAQIITRALNGSPDGKLTLGEIYKWIEDNFDYYKYANPVWKNSIRHNLSLSKCFKKVAREPGTRGKGGKWMIDKEFLIQEENRKKRKSFEDENMLNNTYGVDSDDSKYYQM
ncbi:hypothetical protein P3W45_000133 [Vairimorpha bombi]|jgi:hypothetical protein